MKFSWLALVSISLFPAGVAYSEADVAMKVQSEKTPALKRVSIELKPVELLLNSVPGVASGGLSFEVYVGQNWAVNVGGSYADVNLPQKYIKATNEKANEPLIDKGYGYSAGAGLRYYDDAIGNSLYGGLNLDYSEARYGFKFNEETYATKQFAATPAVVAGYRWVWQNGVLARLGAGVGLPSVQAQTITNESAGIDATKGRAKVSEILNTKVIAKLDMGIGMVF